MELGIGMDTILGIIFFWSDYSDSADRGPALCQGGNADGRFKQRRLLMWMKAHKTWAFFFFFHA